MKQRTKYLLNNFVFWCIRTFPKSRLVLMMENRLRDDEGNEIHPRCQDCNRPYGNKGWIDCIISDEQWVAIGMPEDGGGLLCGACTIDRLEKLPGITYIYMEARE